ncbi:hypothetical protein [Limimaricola pyoseonensis]|uniref:Uncharacterized protein n=1 Tax=Limimaricola pyoseonensis TaxID=521013 RepID=A0A1G7CYP5_9RHOB|nr:hypothetical protein [Limimaricola pyoseonensis]SDE44391.1 hypothetical protein SAMN04488567_1700 [Limimaricola pyoseonensis]
MTANMIAVIGLLLVLAVAVSWAWRERRRRRRLEAERRHAPHAPGDGRDPSAMARSTLEGHAGTR